MSKTMMYMIGYSSSEVIDRIKYRKESKVVRKSDLEGGHMLRSQLLSLTCSAPRSRSSSNFP